MSIVGKRVEVMTHNQFGVALKHGGVKGTAIAPVKPDSEGSYLFRVALDNGAVADFPDGLLIEVESDLTDELTRPAYPAVQTETDQQAASIMAARVWQVMESNRLEILEIEAQIKADQDKIARDIRANYPELYESQQVTGIIFSQHEARIKAGAEAVWQSKGCPEKGKTYGAAQIATAQTLVKFDPESALAYARTQAPNLIQTTVDKERFTRAVKDGTLTNVPESACKWEESHTVKTLTKSLASLADQTPPSAESEG